MAYKLKINKDVCIGCGACASICPKSFEIKDNKAILKKTKIEKLTCEKQAEESCPVNAISIEN